MSKYGKIRAIVIERAADGKRMAIYTNGSSEEIASEKVAQLICRRWGQENLIKELLGKQFHLLHARVRERGYGGATADGQSTGEAVEEAKGDSGK